MTTARASTILPDDRECMIVITGRSGDRALADELAGMYPDWSINACETYLSGLREVLRVSPRVIVAWIGAPRIRLEDAIAGLREAAGKSSRIILCCGTEDEPIARKLLPAGADDFVLHPLESDEVDDAIGYARPPLMPVRPALHEPALQLEELQRWASLVRGIDDRPMSLIEQLAALLHRVVPTRGVTVVVEGAVATSGDAVIHPVLTVPLMENDRTIGHLNIGEPIGAPFTPFDVERLKRYADLAGSLLRAASQQRQWRRLAMTDECTGLPNRRYFLERFAEILTEAAAQKYPLTILLFDVDNFKSYNDNHGHDAGDEVLRLTGELFRGKCREQDVVARYGGDEFAVLFWDPHGPRAAGSRHPDGALQVLDRFKESLRTQPFPKLGPGGTGILTISGGLATFPWDGQTTNDLLKHADEALLAAKRAGKNRIFLIGQAT